MLLVYNFRHFPRNTIVWKVQEKEKLSLLLRMRKLANSREKVEEADREKKKEKLKKKFILKGKSGRKSRNSPHFVRRPMRNFSINPKTKCGKMPINREGTRVTHMTTNLNKSL